MALLIAIPIGVISAIKQYSSFDISVTTFSFAGQALPDFWLGLILILIFYVLLEEPGHRRTTAAGRRHVHHRGSLFHLPTAFRT